MNHNIQNILGIVKEILLGMNKAPYVVLRHDVHKMVTKK